MSSTPRIPSLKELLPMTIPGLNTAAAADVATDNAISRGAYDLTHPNMPQAPKLPDLPDPNDPEVLKKQDEAALAERKRAGAGRASTILTGGTGLLNSAGVARRVLLGN